MSLINSEKGNVDQSNAYATGIYDMFKFSFRTELTRVCYERRLKRFFDYIEFELNNKEHLDKRVNAFAYKAKENKEWILQQIIKFLQFQKDRLNKGGITAGTLWNFIKPLKLLCDVCDIDIKWKRLTRGFPRNRQAANDRAPTLEEIQKLIEYPDRRIKPIVYVMASSGIRLGAWDFLKWNHLTPLHDDKGEIVAAKLLVYAGEVEEYFTFITPEAYTVVKEWMEFRQSYGETITKESWVMRDIWQTTNVKYGARWGLATAPKKLNSSAIKRLIERALLDQGVRTRQSDGKYEFKAVHGLRKFYKSRAEQVMKPLNVELTMGHDIGLSASYYKPTEKEILDDYLKAVDSLTIKSDGVTLKNQVQKLKEESKTNEYIIKGKLQEKDEEIKQLKQNQESIISLLKEEMESKFKEIYDRIDLSK